MQFNELKIIQPVLKALKEENYAVPTSIQEKAIPLIIDRKDVLGSAQTGTGKTAAFAIPILQHLYNDRQNYNKPRKINALIITPTRELAIQIGESFSTYGKYTGIKNTVVFGGVSQGAQTNALKQGVDVLVATPGRLLDLMNQGFIKLKDVEYFVLDEADRMLDMGFINDIKKIIEKLPVKRQSLFFSATMPDNIVALSKKILHKPVKVEINAVSSTADTLQQYLYYTNKQDKKKLLLHILKDPKIEQVLMFSRTKHGADRIAKHLSKKKIHSAAIHGDKAQNQRQKVLNKFKDGELRVLVATDIAARGIDIDKLKYVINYDIPNLPETYVHRIGRAGRAGDEGISISICEPEENVFVKDIEKLINKRIEVIKDNPFPQTDKPMNNAEKKEAAKEKAKRKQEYFANKKKKQDKENQAKPKRNFRK
ncbi:MAG TPA: DEAD/DEAH box helicase [Salinivirga sp.]|uniref:DEAD/DEAH box helicase n=1 Tax=Salinivirga sp. TaxID=1970192 RepID=UPI002B45B006|nr:DEAD/DEAH box helicase [Salinivirga sp.]HKK59938.1 DEAD/DEAH box helicase [Salinivirga sp.]